MKHGCQILGRFWKRAEYLVLGPGIQLANFG